MNISFWARQLAFFALGGLLTSVRWNGLAVLAAVLLFLSVTVMCVLMPKQIRTLEDFDKIIVMDEEAEEKYGHSW